MPNRYSLVTIALVSWTIFGTLILAPGAHFILGYGLIQNAIAVGACFGAIIGLVVGIIGVSPLISANRVSAFRWVLFGSMIGAVIGAVALLWIGGFPRRSQADLSLVFLAPASLVVGAACGIICAGVLWRNQRSH
ncbi:MAG: hypothetical protein KME43_02370 [Myxacorys chilensis ATA2-1-KO14]|jgi:uncharacterized membrane protein|nr:hypothetical protein [Myxacorys chilensis ATA2-1-KO14]